MKLTKHQNGMSLDKQLDLVLESSLELSLESFLSFASLYQFVVCPAAWLVLLVNNPNIKKSMTYVNM